MADKVLSVLKYSYDNLANEKLKPCFLYWSLFPEDYSTGKKDIIGLWIGEGLLGEVVDDFVKAQNDGLDVIDCLKDACLLETGFALGVKMKDVVKMHDVIRDLAIGIASGPGREKGMYLTLQAQSTLKLSEWETAKRVSLINNKAIKELKGAPHCSSLLTLLVQDSSISDISDDFFESMPELEVLNMYDVKLKTLPSSMFTRPKLQFLAMPEYDEDIILQPGSLGTIPELKILYLSESCSLWEVEGGPSLSELESLQHLISLQIILKTGKALQRLVTSPKLQLSTTHLRIKNCPDIKYLTLLRSSPESLLSLGHMIRLRSLYLQCCNELEVLNVMSVDKLSLFTTLEDLGIMFMPNLKIVWDVPQQSFSYVNLNRVVIRGCPKLENITWLIYAQNLEVLVLIDLDGLNEIISSRFATVETLLNPFPSLNYLGLISLRNLKTICECNVKFFRLENISVERCPELKKIPFNTNSVIPQTLQKIEGEEIWWVNLDWEDEATKSKLAAYFRNI